MDDTISRQAAINKFEPWLKVKGYSDGELNMLKAVLYELTVMPSAQPEHTETHSCDCERTGTHDSRREWYMKGYRDAQNAALHESCTDCPLYDHDRHNCPRFNKVIPTAILDAQPRWIPFETREPDAEEKQEHPEWDFVLCGKLPQDGQRILVNIKYKGHEAVQMDEYNDDGRECYLHSGYDIATEATAWMPLPEPWRGEENDA